MSGGEAGGLIQSWASHILSAGGGAAVTLLLGWTRGTFYDVTECLKKIDQSSSDAERQLHLHARGQCDIAGLTVILTARTDIGIIAQRQFGRRVPRVLTQLELFSEALDSCDPEASNGVPLGGDAEAAVATLRTCQQALRTSINKTVPGRVAKLATRFLRPK